jgi:hypothetical protein
MLSRSDDVKSEAMPCPQLTESQRQLAESQWQRAKGMNKEPSKLDLANTEPGGKESTRAGEAGWRGPLAVFEQMHGRIKEEAEVVRNREILHCFRNGAGEGRLRVFPLKCLARTWRVCGTPACRQPELLMCVRA